MTGAGHDSRRATPGAGQACKRSRSNGLVAIPRTGEGRKRHESSRTLTSGRLIAGAVALALRKRRKFAGNASAVGTHMARSRHHWRLMIGIAVVLGLLLMPVAPRLRPATTATCWMPRPNGRTISQHTPACYAQALAELPADVDNYLPAVRSNSSPPCGATRPCAHAPSGARPHPAERDRRPRGRRRRTRPRH